MTLQDWVVETTDKFKDIGILTPRLDAEVLLADALGKDRSWIHAHDDTILTEAPFASGMDSDKLNAWIDRRLQHEPISYIRGWHEFYGHKFTITKNTLTPRPESEDILDLLKNHLGTEKNIKNIIDMGTGSGCLIISAALQAGPNSKIKFTGYDISDAALKVAKQNAKNLDVKVDFVKIDVSNPDDYAKLPSGKTVVLANLPYVPTNVELNNAAKHEPEISIFAGKGGLELYRPLFKNLNKSSVCAVITESLAPQHKDLIALAEANGYTLAKARWLVHLFTAA